MSHAAKITFAAETEKHLALDHSHSYLVTTRCYSWEKIVLIAILIYNLYATVVAPYYTKV